MSKLDRLRRSGVTLSDAAYVGSLPDRVNQFHSEYLEAWAAFDEGRGGPELAGPLELLDLHEELHNAGYDYSIAVEALWDARNSAEELEAAKDVFVRRSDELSAKRRAYRLAAVNLISVAG